jgi:hypothetical protein
MAVGPFVMSDIAGNDIGYVIVVVYPTFFYWFASQSLTIAFATRYKIRGEKGLLRDPATGIVGPNRKQMRYTELADEMVEQLGRLGQKAKKVRRHDIMSIL